LIYENRQRTHVRLCLTVRKGQEPRVACVRPGLT
jgi:hypothetical protein